MIEKRTIYTAQMVVYRRTPGISILLLGLQKVAEGGGLYWQSPRGGIEENETPVDAALRETREETGIEKPLVFIDLDHTHRFEYSTTDHATGKQLVTTVIEESFAIETDREYIVLSDEHTGYRWMTPEEAMEVFDYEGIKQAVRQLLSILNEDR